jgi:hypothetical protein
MLNQADFIAEIIANPGEIKSVTNDCFLGDLGVLGGKHGI